MNDLRESVDPGFSATGSPKILDVSIDRDRVKLSGEIDLDGCDRLAEALTTAFEPGAPLTVDMSGVSFMDSSGLRAFLVAQQQRDVTVVDPSPRVRLVFEVTGLCDTFHIR